jgi:DNA-binding response OmpR family regulator
MTPPWGTISASVSKATATDDLVPHRRRRPLSHVTETKPGIVPLELGLPDLDGVELTRTIRRDNPEILLIILTTRSGQIDVIVSLDAGADDYLVKPFSLTVLLARLRAHLRRGLSLQPLRPPSG